ncbi:acyltransferase family protein [Acetobacter nitrogenifigens]|uniref:Acyltransferase n=1 Tax=Acetobacter nitrogenifigens DSM 23921 = NBRC 105050 TaxID=1120919 RepID=A0A511X5P3_9PROT|nr:acyltransferase [Acetobacter nitrogenifigens]GEN58253.1 acyltransferase [Acetobacter nitrogenifigens DSM 23921 = NBRC 105050]
MSVVSRRIVVKPDATQPDLGSRVRDLDVLRALAVTMVLIEHSQINLLFWDARIARGWLLNGGFWTGVDIFFAISGYVIARPLLPRLVSIRDARIFADVAIRFWIRRVWRLLPSAWLWLFAALLLSIVYNRSGAFGSVSANFEGLVAGVLDLANFRMAWIYGQHGVGAAFVQWSLSLEEQFYLTLPLLIVIFRRFTWLPMAILVVSSFRAMSMPLDMMLRVGAIAAGVLLAQWSMHDTWRMCEPTGLASRRIFGPILLFGCVLMLIALGTSALHIVSFRMGPISVLCAVLVWAASYNRDYLWPYDSSRPWLLYVAARSYSLYLVHVPSYFFVHETWFRFAGRETPGRVAAVGIVLSGVALTFGLAELNYRFVEMPLRNHGRRLAASFVPHAMEITR